jgi:hypothetical protein
MKERGINIYLLQETWLERTYNRYVEGYLFIHHGLDKATCNRGTGVAGILLSPSTERALDKAGNPPPILGGVIAKTTRFIGLHLDLDTENQQGINKIFICSKKGGFRIGHPAPS